MSFRHTLLLVGTLAAISPLAAESPKADAEAPAAKAASRVAFPGFPSPEERRRLAELANIDRAQMMAQLHISEPKNLPPEESDPNRPPGLKRPANNPSGWTDAEGHFVVRSSWGNWINYDLAKADRGLPLPDPLVLKNGQPVKDAATWWSERRPEIVHDFETEIYGRVPADLPKITWEVASTEPHALEGRAKLQRIIGHIDNSSYPAAKPSIRLTLYIPANAKGPVPVVVTIGGFEFPPGFKFPGMPEGPSTLEQTLAHGWGFAKFDTLALQADNGAGLVEGIIGLANRGQRRKPDDWGAIRAWVWGLSRAIDFLETDPEVDAKRLAVEGHSRYGKTALVAAAFEPRWAVAFASCSGEGGAKLHRHDYGESVDIVAWGGEYHWMAGNFLKYGGHWGDLPLDQHELIALVAPRPILITGGSQDPWPDPVGMFKACVAASPVYRLLGKAGIDRATMPKPDEALIDGDLAFRMHTGGHFDVLDWPTFLRFADKYFELAH